MKFKMVIDLLKKKKYLILLFSAIIIHVTLFFIASIYNYNHFWYGAFDFGIFNQGIWLLSQLKSPFITIRGLYLFGEHASFITILIVPLYKIFPSPYTLLFLETFALSIAAFPLYLISKKLLKSPKYALAISIMYLLYPAVHFIDLESFHPINFAVPFLFSAFYFLFEKKWGFYFVSLFLAIICNELIAVAILFLGIYVFLKHNKKIGIITIVLSILYGLFVMNIIFPFFNEGKNIFYEGRWFGSYGKTPLDKISSLFNIKFMSSKIFTEKNAKYIFDIFSPVSFISFLSPEVILFAGPLYVTILTDWPYAHSIHYHYVAPIIPFVFISLIFSLKKIKRFNKRYVKYVILILLFSSFLGSYYLGPKEKFIYKFSNLNNFNEWENKSYELIASIPDNAKVSATYNFVTHLSQREKIFMFPNPYKSSYYGFSGYEVSEENDMDFILIDKRLIDKKDIIEVVDNLKKKYKIEYEDDTLLLLKNG